MTGISTRKPGPRRRPGWMVEAWISTCTAIRDGEPEAVSDDVVRLLGRPATAFRDAVTPARRRVDSSDGVDPGFTVPSRAPVSVGAMKTQMVALFGLAAYMVWTSTFAGLMLGFVPAPGL